MLSLFDCFQIDDITTISAKQNDILYYFISKTFSMVFFQKTQLTILNSDLGV